MGGGPLRGASRGLAHELESRKSIIWRRVERSRSVRAPSSFRMRLDSMVVTTG
jgi:hypothetical protein